LKLLSEDIDLDNGNGMDISHLEDDLLTRFRSMIGYAAVTGKTQEGEWGICRTTIQT